MAPVNRDARRFPHSRRQSCVPAKTLARADRGHAKAKPGTLQLGFAGMAAARISQSAAEKRSVRTSNPSMCRSWASSGDDAVISAPSQLFFCAELCPRCSSIKAGKVVAALAVAPGAHRLRARPADDCRGGLAPPFDVTSLVRNRRARRHASTPAIVGKVQATISAALARPLRRNRGLRRRPLGTRRPSSQRLQSHGTRARRNCARSLIHVD